MSSVKSFPSELQQEKKGLVNDPWKKHKWPRRTASILPHCNPVLGKLAAFRATPFLLLTNRAQPAGPEQESQTAAALTPVCSPMTKAPGILPITPGGKRTWTWRWQQPGVSPVPHSLEDNLDELLLDISTLTVPTWSWNINSNFRRYKDENIRQSGRLPMHHEFSTPILFCFPHTNKNFTVFLFNLKK